jgi:hypothetical protein
MKNNFTPSINIIRDTDRDFYYIPTPNAQRIVSQLALDFKAGIRSFNIIGSYGTGKSSFLLALEQTLRNKKPYFNARFVQDQTYDVIKIIGNYSSLKSAFVDHFDLSNYNIKSEFIFAEIFNRYNDIDKRTPLLFIEIDEFGKFLEFAASNNPEQELYFIQQLAEFVSNPSNNIVLLTTIHQSFESYGFSLSDNQRQEWTKVKGRFREIPFNEPVEQLLFLASEFISDSVSIEIDQEKLVNSYEIFKKTRAFNFTERYSQEINVKIYPLDALAANTLTLALQRYGQNERSLFSFLEATDHTSLRHFKKIDADFYNLASVYDYLNFNFYNFLNSRFNPDFALWASIKSALESVERELDYNIHDFSKIIKTIGLLNIFAASGSDLGKQFLSEYSLVCLNISSPDELIEKLISKHIIRYRNHSRRFVPFEGTDLDIQTALIEATNKVSLGNDLVTLINRHCSFNNKTANAYSFEKGTIRTFKYEVSDSPLHFEPEGDIDGYINLVFSEYLTVNDIKKASSVQGEAILYGYYLNTKDIRSHIIEIEKTQNVINENSDDKVAKRELENILQHHKNLLNHSIESTTFGEKSEVVWIWNGEKKEIDSPKSFNKLLSLICFSTYDSTPVFKNELINKHRISSQAHSAKRNYFKALANSWQDPNLGFDQDKFPPEKTIFLTLLKENGLSPFRDDFNLNNFFPSNESFRPLWEASVKFLESAKNEKRKITDLIEILQKRPFKLKQGLIDFWLPTFLFLKRDEFALFGQNGFIPNLSDDNLELISKDPSSYQIKTFDIDGVRLDLFNSYRILLNQETKEKLSSDSFIETIKPFLVFYKQLTEYSKHTKRLSKEALLIRQAIVDSKDPEKTFFEDFPRALRTSSEDLANDKEKLSEYSDQLQSAIRDIRTSFDKLVDRFEEFIQDQVVFEKVEFDFYKAKLQKRFSVVKSHLMLPYQKTFVQRIESALDDRRAWLSSISQSVVNKPLENLSDEDEALLYDRFKSWVMELDSLTILSKAIVDVDKEELLGIQFDSFVNGIKKTMIRLPKSKTAEIENIKESVKSVLSDDKSLNIAALTRLLKEILGQ